MDTQDVLTLVGLGIVVIGLGLIAVPAGVIGLGIGFLILAYLVEMKDDGEI